MSIEANRTSLISHQTSRLFVALPLEASVREVIGSVQSQLRIHNWPVKWVDPELAHVTLKFLGETDGALVPDIERALEDVAARHQPVDFTIGTCGAFPQAFRPRVFWLGLDGDESALAGLASDVNAAMSAFGFDPEEQPFKAHITIGRLRKQMIPPAVFEQLAGFLDVPSIPVSFDRMQLIQSVLSNDGPLYTVLAEWTLGAVPSKTGSNLIEIADHG